RREASSTVIDVAAAAADVAFVVGDNAVVDREQRYSLLLSEAAFPYVLRVSLRAISWTELCAGDGVFDIVPLLSSRLSASIALSKALPPPPRGLPEFDMVPTTDHRPAAQIL
ncbi:hypothetical protein FOZ63_014518, partial [Perkinsus olseni]